MKRYRHLNFFEHQCELEVLTPRVRLPEGRLHEIEPPWAGKLENLTLPFEAFVSTLSREMSFCGVARLTKLNVDQVLDISLQHAPEEDQMVG